MNPIFAVVHMPWRGLHHVGGGLFYGFVGGMFLLPFDATPQHFIALGLAAGSFAFPFVHRTQGAAAAIGCVIGSPIGGGICRLMLG